jgi:hypothetical protein
MDEALDGRTATGAPSMRMPLAPSTEYDTMNRYFAMTASSLARARTLIDAASPSRET